MLHVFIHTIKTAPITINTIPSIAFIFNCSPRNNAASKATNTRLVRSIAATRDASAERNAIK